MSSGKVNDDGEKTVLPKTNLLYMQYIIVGGYVMHTLWYLEDKVLDLLLDQSMGDVDSIMLPKYFPVVIFVRLIHP